MVKFFCALIITLVFSNSFLHACTGLMLKAKDGSFVHGRTLEFGVKVDTAATVIPKNFEFTGTTPQGPGLHYKAKYGAVGSIAFNQPALLDGMNEKGLSVGSFYFPGYAGYAHITSENQSKALSPVEFPNWIVTQFATVEEVKSALSSVVIAPTIVKEWGPAALPLHYIVYDKSGKSLVIEPVDGKLLAYENKLGVLTNSPDFGWHMTNLRNYINLRAINAPPLKIDGLELEGFGQGSGLAGLPGDFTPPSRFVQASIFELTAIPAENSEKAIFQIFHILNHFDIPVGSIREVVGGVTYMDYTLLTCARDPQTLKYYFRSFEDQTIRVVDLNKFDLNAKEIKFVDNSKFDKQAVVNISEDLRP